MATQLTPEKGSLTLSSVETAKLVVSQPAKLQELTKLLESFENLNLRVSERMGEDRSGDLGGAGAATGTQTGTGTGQTARDQAIAGIPTIPAALQKKLSAHIQEEMRNLEKKARALSGSASHQGGAFHLNELYARIRRLNALLADIFEASIEILRRLFIRVFIDKQPIL